MKIFTSLLAALMLLSLTANAHDGADHEHGLMVESAWAPHTGGRTMSGAIYMVIKNEGKEADALVGVSTPAAGVAMLHESREEDGIMKMDHVDSLPLPAGGSAALKRGSYHIMLMQLTDPLKKGEVFPVTLEFEKAGEVTITVEITGIGGPK